MSDYEDYPYQYQQPQEQEMEEENIETTLQFENCQAEQYLRQKKYQQALKAFTQIYDKANQNNIRTWKAKALHQILDMHVHMNNDAEVRKTLHMIREMNEVDKTNEQAVKSIIKSLNAIERNVYQSFWEDIFALISGLEDPHSQLKCYFLMMQKQIQLKNEAKAKQIFQKIKQLAQKVPNISLSSQFQLHYLQILLLKLQNQDYSSNLRQLYLKIPLFEQDTTINQTFISKIKQQIAPTLYMQSNFTECAGYLCSYYIENSKYGSNNQRNRELLKINLLMLLLIGDQELLQDKEYNPLLQESIVTYKSDADIQALYALAQAFKSLDINRFQEIMETVNLNLPKDSPYSSLQKRVLLSLKKQKIASICKCYKNIKFSYLQRRVNESDPQVIIKLLFSLITSKKINGVIHLKDEYLQILPQENKFFTLQLENLKDLTERM